MPTLTVKRRLFVLLSVPILMAISGAIWFQVRYFDAPTQWVALTTFSDADYPEDPEERSAVFGTYPHKNLIIHRLGGTRFRFLLEPATPQAAAIELTMSISRTSSRRSLQG